MEGSVNDISDAELVRRVIHVCQSKRLGRKQPLWASVADQFCLGSAYAAQLCRKFGFDPNAESRA